MHSIKYVFFKTCSSCLFLIISVNSFFQRQDQRDVEEKVMGVIFTDKDRKSMFKKILESHCDIKEDSADRSDVRTGE